MMLLDCKMKRMKLLKDRVMLERLDNKKKSRSRLHFIGTWRNRYRKCFLSQSHELKSPGVRILIFVKIRKLHQLFTLIWKANIEWNGPSPELRDNWRMAWRAQVALTDSSTRNNVTWGTFFLFEGSMFCSNWYHMKLVADAIACFAYASPISLSKREPPGVFPAWLEIVNSTPWIPCKLVANARRKTKIRVTVPICFGVLISEFLRDLVH